MAIENQKNYAVINQDGDVTTVTLNVGSAKFEVSIFNDDPTKITYHVKRMTPHGNGFVDINFIPNDLHCAMFEVPRGGQAASLTRYETQLCKRAANLFGKLQLEYDASPNGSCDYDKHPDLYLSALNIAHDLTLVGDISQE